MMARAAAVLAVLLAAPGAVLAEESDARFDAFLEACLDGHRDPAARAAAIDVAGWLPVADDAHPSLAALLAISREGMGKAAEEDDLTGSLAAYSRPADETPLYLVTTEVNMPEESEFRVDFLGCYLYDFAAGAALPPGIVTAHFDEPPAQTIDEPGLMVAQTWNIEKIDGVWELSNNFIPAGSPAANLTGFSGLLLKLTSTKE